MDMIQEPQTLLRLAQLQLPGPAGPGAAADRCGAPEHVGAALQQESERQMRP